MNTLDPTSTSDTQSQATGPGRRSFLAAMSAAAGGMLVACTGIPKKPTDSEKQQPASAQKASNHRTRVVLLGVAGGPSLFTDQVGCGVSTAIAYGDRVYIVDLGDGALANLNRSGLRPETPASALNQVRGIFFTHLHSDHITDWPTMYTTAASNSVGRESGPIEVFGPGDRPVLGRMFPETRPESSPVNPEAPSPGITGMTGGIRSALAADFNDRIRDSNLPDPATLFNLHDIDLSGIWDVDEAGIPPRLSEPIHIWQDDDVTVTATLVDHRPTAPAFAYRFDTPDGSIVVSGDTTVSENLVDLARGADCLVHEVIDPAFVEQVTASLPEEIVEPSRQHLLQAHTTIEQVGRDVAQPAGVTTLVLSHLIPPTGTVERWRPAQEGFDGTVLVGQDLQQIGIGQQLR